MQTASASIQKASGNLHKVNPTTAYHQGNQNVCNAMTTASVNTTTSPAHCCFNTATGMAPTSEGKAVIPINPAIADKTAQLRAQAVVSPTLSTASTNSASSISQPSTPTSIASTQQSQSASPSLDKETATSKGVCQDASQCAASEVVPFDVEAMIHETTQRGRRWSSPRNEMEAKRLCAICFALTKIGIQEGLVILKLLWRCVKDADEAGDWETPNTAVKQVIIKHFPEHKDTLLQLVTFDKAKALEAKAAGIHGRSIPSVSGATNNNTAANTSTINQACKNQPATSVSATASVNSYNNSINISQGSANIPSAAMGNCSKARPVVQTSVTRAQRSRSSEYCGPITFGQSTTQSQGMRNGSFLEAAKKPTHMEHVQPAMFPQTRVKRTASSDGVVHCPAPGLTTTTTNTAYYPLYQATANAVNLLKLNGAGSSQPMGFIGQSASAVATRAESIYSPPPAPHFGPSKHPIASNTSLVSMPSSGFMLPPAAPMPSTSSAPSSRRSSFSSVSSASSYDNPFTPLSPLSVGSSLLQAEPCSFANEHAPSLSELQAIGRTADQSAFSPNSSNQSSLANTLGDMMGWDDPAFAQIRAWAVNVVDGDMDACEQVHANNNNSNAVAITTNTNNNRSINTTAIGLNNSSVFSWLGQSDRQKLAGFEPFASARDQMVCARKVRPVGCERGPEAVTVAPVTTYSLF